MKELYTKAGENLSGTPWNVYPRPQLKRDSFYCLNGEWEFAVTDGEAPAAYDRKILVPFAPESLLSGVHIRFDECKTLWYRRTFTLPQGFVKSRVILHFGAVDQICKIYLNGSEIAEHIGGYHAFSVDITGHMQAENTLVVRVNDNLSNFRLPYGKQCKKRGGMWYTSVSGIWQTVWIESVPESYISGIKITTEGNTVNVKISGIDSGEIRLGETATRIENGEGTFEVPSPKFWSPEEPHLYYFTVQSGEDLVQSYFALRDLEIKEINGKSRLCLNGAPYFFHGLLDQGYYSDGIFTPAVHEEYAADIIKMKSLGFNMLRKHIKVEPEQFYYECDRLGMVVFQDMVNNGDYNFFRDTALPTVGFIKKCDKHIHRDEETRENFIREMEQTVLSLYNHPSVCYWTIFNEGWGQFSSDEMYHRLKSLDNTRFVDSTSGWFFSGESDVDSRHIYFKKLKLKVGKKPLVLSEFGGYVWKDNEHSFNQDKAYGYRQFGTREAFLKAVQDLYLDEVLPLVKNGLSAAVYTQVSDVEDETNGILTYDRRVQKILPKEFLNVSKRLIEYGKKV